MLTHELAKELLKTATFLLSKSNVETNESSFRLRLSYYNKDSFLDAVRAFGSGKKDVGSYDFSYVPNKAQNITLSIARNEVCNKVQEEKWECQPLMTPEQFTRG